MVFKKLLGSLGIGGPSVDTVLSNPTVTPGEPLTGQVHIRGGGSDVDIDGITLILAAQAPVASGQYPGARTGVVEVARIPVAGRFPLPADTAQSIPFTVQVPWETPITSVYGQALPGITMGLHTELSVARSSDKTDLDPVVVAPLGVHQAILDALGTLGCRFIRTDLRPGAEIGQLAPYAQRVVFYPPATGGFGHQPQLAFTFAANAQAVDVAVESAGGGQDRYTVAHDAEGPQLEQAIEQWVRAALARVPQQPAGAGFLNGPANQQQSGRAGAGQGQQRRPGMGGAVAAGVAGGALGFLGGMMVGNMIGDAMTPDAAAMDPGVDPGAMDAGAMDAGGMDAGGFEDFGGFGDFGGGFDI